MKKKTLSILLAMTMCTVTLTSCGTRNVNQPESSAASTESSQDASETAPTETESEQAPVDSTNPETDEKPNDVIPEASSTIGVKTVQIENNYSDTVRENYNCVTVSRTAFELETAYTAAYPALANTLDQRNSGLKADMDDTMTGLKESYEEMADSSFFSPLEDMVTSIVVRSDETVFSWVDVYSSYWGGAHGYYSRSGYAIDPVTGKQIGILDVVIDEGSLRKQLAEKLYEEYGEETFFNDIFETMDNYNLEDVCWSMDYDGVTFYFNPYELAPYAAGMQSVTFRFAEHPEILNQKYAATPSKYVLSMEEGKTYYADINHDGKDEPVIFNREYIGDGESGYEYTPTFKVNGKDLPSEISDYSDEAYLINNMSDYYIYLFHHVENDYSILEVVDLNGEKIYGNEYEYANYYLGGAEWTYEDEGDYTCYRTTKVEFVNPDSFILGKGMDLLSTYGGNKTYHVGANGIPATEDKFYNVNANFLLIPLKGIACEKVDADGNVVEKEATLAPGQYVKIIRATDDSVDLVGASDYVPEAEDEYSYGYLIGNQKLSYDMSSIYRITFEKDKHYEINGESLFDLFDGLMFAG